MARVEVPVVVTNPTSGAVIQGASVQVNKRSDGTAATVFADEASGTTVTNPLVSDAQGNVAGWVPRGAYNLVISATGYATRTVPWDAVPGSDAGIDAAALAGGTVPTGVMMVWPYAEASVPAGWLLIFGQLLSRTTYSALHALAAAAAYPDGSGDGSTTFNAPDMRGRTAVGKDNMGGSAAGRVTRTGGTVLGASLGTEYYALLIADLPPHAHSTTFTQPTIAVTDGGHAHNFQAGNQTVNSPGLGAPGGYGGGFVPAGTNTATALTGITAVATGGAVTVQNQGGGGAHDNMQPSKIVNWIIKT